MKTIEIDDEVFAYLQSTSIPYIEATPNATLRRLFNLNDKGAPEGVSKGNMPESRGRKVNLPTLVKSGLIQEGQTLFLHDYQGRIIEGYEAIVSGNLLSRNGKLESMSGLAKKGLKEIGFKSEAVRGPAFWYNSDGISIRELWSRFLNK